MSGGEIHEKLYTFLIDSGVAEPKRIDFRFMTPPGAFEILEEEEVGQKAILWEGERRLATLTRTSAGGWQLTA